MAKWSSLREKRIPSLALTILTKLRRLQMLKKILLLASTTIQELKMLPRTIPSPVLTTLGLLKTAMLELKVMDSSLMVNLHVLQSARRSISILLSMVALLT